VILENKPGGSLILGTEAVAARAAENHLASPWARMKRDVR
jgi:hypothetical protein